MNEHWYVEALVLLLPAVCSLGILLWFFISMGQAFKKFDSLNARVQTKLLALEWYMAAVRNFSKEELLTLCTLPDEELRRFNTIRGYDERIQAIRGVLKKTNQKTAPTSLQYTG